MLTYNEIIGINKNYCPYYDLMNEKEGAWKYFIPTPQFYELLSGTLEILEKNNISMWIQGAYGTGKSHATGLVKHLLYLNQEEINDSLDSWNNVGLKSRLTAFREKNRVFPVIMYGSNKITNQIDFGLQIEIGVRRAFEKAGINLTTPTDFDTYIKDIENDRSNYWDILIEEEYTITEIAKDKKTMLAKLRAYDQDLFMAIREAINRRGRHIAVKDTVSWLGEITAHLRDNHIATHVMIYWDEFTTILDKNNSDIHTEIQRIAEASSETGAFLYLISHRTAIQGLRKEDREKLLGRFKDVSYDMSDITTYLLMSHAIQKIDRPSWDALKDKHARTLDKTIDHILDIDSNGSKQDIQNLFPIHPYTAHVTSYIARVLGSTERSIFDFLNDRVYGFASFIANCPGKKNVEFLTLDYAFDFFQKVFEGQNDPFFASLMQKYLNNKNILEREKHEYVSLMKVLLTINIANYKSNAGDVNNKLVVPNKENLKLALAGSGLSEYIDEFLKFIDSKKIIVRDHAQRYLVDAASFDHGEIGTWILQNRSKYKSIEEIFPQELKDILCEPLLSNHRRSDCTKVIVMDAETQEHLIKNRVSMKMKSSYELNLMLFVAKNLNDLSEIKKSVLNVAKDNSTPVCYWVMDQIFSDDEVERYLDFKAKAEIAHKNHNTEAEAANLKNVDGLLRQWITRAKQQSLVDWFVIDKDSDVITGRVAFNSAYDVINKEVSQIIFHQSFDTLLPRLSQQPAWKKMYAMKYAELYLNSSSFNELSKAASNGPSKAALDILYSKNGDILVNDKLKVVTHHTDHPLLVCMKKIENKMSGSEEVNLVDVFDFLFKAPFGFYQNYVFLAAAAFILRKYKGKLYSSKTGEILSDLTMLDVIEKIFKAICENRHVLKPDLQVRIGSQHETQFVKLLEEMFELPECNSIVDTRHKLADWLKKNLAMPLWFFNHGDDLDIDTLTAIDIIREKVLSLQSDQINLSPTDYKNMFQTLEETKASLMRTLKNVSVETRKTLMMAFVKEVNETIGTYYTDSHFDDLLSHLKRNLQTDPIYWEESKVAASVQSWYIDKTSEMRVPVQPENEEIVIVQIPLGNQEDIETKVITSIKSYKGDFKSFMIEYIQKNRKLLNFFHDMVKEFEDD